MLRKWWKLLAAFLCKQKDICFGLLMKIVKDGEEADFLIKALRVGDLNGAITSLQKVRNISVDSGNHIQQIQIYQELGQTYQRLGQHQNAIKCFKKQLELSWVIESTAWQMSAYDNLGMQYYYTGDVQAAKYYHDRMVRGKSQSGASITKKMTIDNAKAKFQKRKLQLLKQQTANQISTLLKKASSNKKLQKEAQPKIDHIVKKSLNDDPISKAIRPITPVPNMKMNELPSPRGKGRGANNTYNLLPFFQEDQFSKEYQLQQQKMDKQRGNRAQ